MDRLTEGDPDGRFALFGLVALVHVLIGLGSLFLPIGGDQGNYAYAAWEWMEGAVPYRDVMVFKPPVTLFLHSVAHGLFGHSMFGIRVVDLIWQIATALLLAHFTLQWTGSRTAAACAGILYPFAYYQLNFWHTAQTEGWFALPVLLALTMTTRGSRHGDWRAMVVAGASIGVAVGLKYTFLAALLPVLVLVFLAGTPGQYVRLLSGLGVGMAISLVAGVGWLVGIGAWSAFVDHHVHTLPNYAAMSVHGRGWDGLAMMWGRLIHTSGLSVMGWLLALGAAILVVERVQALRARSAGSRRKAQGTISRVLAFRLVSLAFLLAAAASTYSQGKFFDYHYLTWLAPVAMLAGEAIASATADLRRGLQGGLLGTLLVLAIGVTPVRQIPWDLVLVASGRTTLAEHWDDARFETPNHSVPESMALVRWLEANTLPANKVFLWGREPGVNYLAARRAPTRFIHNYDFRFPWRDPGLESSLLSELRAEPPEIVVVASDDSTVGASGNPMDSRELLGELPALSGWIAEGYREETIIGRFQVLRREVGSPGASRPETMSGMPGFTDSVFRMSGTHRIGARSSPRYRKS
jgi:4-amino-4-deoxy-L-arabinose transferase-like glycosyltransferase